MFCEKCGREMEEGTIFCTGCGSRLEAEKAEKSSNKVVIGLLIGGICLTLVILGILLVVLLNKSKASDEEASHKEKEPRVTVSEETTVAEAEDIPMESVMSAEEEGKRLSDSELAQTIQKMNAESAISAIPIIQIYRTLVNPGERDFNAKWDSTLFYTLEDVDKESPNDGKINTYSLEKRFFINNDTGNTIEYEIYIEPVSQKMQKVVSIEQYESDLEITEYYFTLEGKINFIYQYRSENYLPSYATPNRDGDRYYFDRDILVKWRNVSDGVQINFMLGREAASVGINRGVNMLLSEMSPEQLQGYNAQEVKMLNAAYNTYNQILNSEEVALLQGYIEGASAETDIELSPNGQEDETLFRTTPDSTGLYRIAVPAVTGNYMIRVIQKGCEDAVMYDIQTDKLTVGDYLEQIFMVEIGESDIELVVDDALNYNETGDGMRRISNALFEIRKGIRNFTGEIISSDYTDENGLINVCIPNGMYTIRIIKEGYADAFCTLAVGRNNTDTQIHMSPKLEGGNIRIVLTWGSTPWDLDSHLFTPDCETDIAYYNKYDNKGNSLDVDITTSYGPETVTISNLEQIGLYKYYVADFTNLYNPMSMEMSYSQASVNVFSSAGLIATYHVPTNRQGVIWEVFEIRNGQIIPTQRYYNSVEEARWGDK